MTDATRQVADPHRRLGPEVLRLLPIALLAVATGAATHLWAVTGIVIAVLVLVVLVGRVQLDTFGQLAFSLLAIGTATAVTAAVVPGLAARRMLPLGPAWTFLALTGLFLTLPRLFYARPVGGARTTAAFGLLTALALGGTRGYPGGTLIGFLLGTKSTLSVRPYVELLVVYGALQLLALMSLDPIWSSVLSAPRRARRLLVLSAVVGTLAAAISVPLALGLPFAHDWAMKKLIGDSSGARSGFSDYARLGSLQGMLLSDVLALRIRGLPAPYLRGIVYSHYFDGQWSAAIGAATTPYALPAVRLEPAPEHVVVEYARTDESHLFLPLGATVLTAEPRSVDVDDMGIVTATNGGVSGLVFGFVPAVPESVRGATKPLRVAPHAPTVEDFRVPEYLGTDLLATASEWTHGAVTPRARVDALLAYFSSHFEYSLEFERPDDVDPVLTFLNTDRRGHCEYFASAMTLLCRALGIPARMVAGYLVSEQNPLTGDWVVRDRDAHAWTEVWLDGAWRTVDATPGAANLTREGMSWFGAVLDALRVWASRAWDKAQTLSIAAIAVVVGGLVLALVWAQWRRARRAAAVVMPPALAVALRDLQRRGLARHPSEPLERFAIRVRAAGEGALADALERYAAARYADLDTGPALEALAAAPARPNG